MILFKHLYRSNQKFYLLTPFEYIGSSKWNCRWITREIQNRNKRTNRNITIDGETKVITDWCNQYGQQVSVVRRRLNRGLTIKEALEWH